MAERNDGGPAFPIIDVFQPWDRERDEPDLIETRITARGMSLRDYFAGQAMYLYRNKRELWAFEEIAHWAYAIADAMLKAREAK